MKTDESSAGGGWWCLGVWPKGKVIKGQPGQVVMETCWVLAVVVDSGAYKRDEIV